MYMSETLSEKNHIYLPSRDYHDDVLIYDPPTVAIKRFNLFLFSIPSVYRPLYILLTGDEKLLGCVLVKKITKKLITQLYQH